MITLTEGDNCFVMEYSEDFREIATILSLRGGRDEAGEQIVAVATDENAAAIYGKRKMQVTESQWTISGYCMIRALQLLSHYSKPTIAVRVDAEPEPVLLGDQVTFTSTTIGIDDVFTVVGINFEQGAEGETMILDLTNEGGSGTADLPDIIRSLAENIAHG